MKGKRKDKTSGNMLWKIYNKGMCIPKTTNVPFEIVCMIFDADNLFDTQNNKNVNKIALTAANKYE